MLDHGELLSPIRAWQMEVEMKRLSVSALAVAILLGLAAFSTASNIGQAIGKPDVFCQVLKEPDPLLIGSWTCIFERAIEDGKRETNPAEYRLIKSENQYALYFYRTSRDGRKRYMGWREWTINGTQITSGSGVRIFVENGEIFFAWKDGTPVKMTRVDP
jgi:hypothetical protein